MFGLNIKVTAFMLVNILVVHGKIYQEDRYLMDVNHVEGYHRLYSDNDRSDVFDNSASKLDFDVPNLGIENLERGFLNRFPGAVEDETRQDAEVPLNQDLDMGKRVRNVFPVPDTRLDLEDLRQPDFLAWGLPNVFGRNKYPIRKPGRNEMKTKCQNIKGLPTPESGCCGLQKTRFPFESQHPGGRFIRSADSETLPSKMISGGKATDLHQFPWMVRLSIDARVAGIGTPKSCGGTIISSRYVLTAAHCLYGTYKNLKQLTVILAEYNSDTYPKDCNGQECVTNEIRKVEHVYMHPDFNNSYLQNDVALLRLSSDIDYSDDIRPVCLPTEDIADQSDEPLIIAGWGLNGRTESNLKRSAIVNYVPDDKCQDEYSYKDDSLFCSIGGNGEDICQGDSGGPLMVHSDGKYFLSGIVNGKRGNEECGSTVPSLFNNVFYHLEWIKNCVH